MLSVYLDKKKKKDGFESTDKLKKEKQTTKKLSG